MHWNPRRKKQLANLQQVCQEIQCRVDHDNRQEAFELVEGQLLLLSRPAAWILHRIATASEGEDDIVPISSVILEQVTMKALHMDAHQVRNALNELISHGLLAHCQRLGMNLVAVTFEGQSVISDML